MPNEKEALLKAEGTSEQIPNHGSKKDIGDKARSILGDTYREDLADSVRLSASVVVVFLCRYALQVVPIIFCGFLSSTELAAASLAISVINVVVLGLATGLCAGGDSYLPQLYGSNRKKQVGVMLQKTIALLLLSALPTAVFLLNIERLLLLLKQDPLVSRVTSKFLLVFIPALPACFINIAVKNYLLCQKLVKPLIFAGLASITFEALAHYILVFVLGYRVIGSAAALFLTYYVNMSIPIVYIIVSKVYKDTWPGLTVACLCEWGQYFIACLSGMCVVLMRWFVMEAGIVVAGMLGTIEIGAMGIAYGIQGLLYMALFSFNSTIPVLVGRALGRGDSKRARSVYRMLFFVAICLALLFGGAVFGLRKIIPMAYTNIKPVLVLTPRLLTVVCANVIVRCVAMVHTATLRALKRPQVSPFCVFFSYLTGVVCGVAMTFYTRLDIEGFLVGMTICYTLDAIAETAFVYTTDWEERSKMMSSQVPDQQLSINSEDNERQALIVSENTAKSAEDDDFSYRDLDKWTKIRTLFIFFLFLGIFIAGVLYYVIAPSPLVNSSVCLPLNLTKESPVFNIFDLPHCDL